MLQRRVEAALKELGLSVASEVLGRLDRFYGLLLRWSGRVRLVGSTELGVVAVRHLADSFTLLPLLRDVAAGARVLDVGSGAGLPGIPLALARPDLLIEMVEPDHRKAGFIRAAVADLGVSPVRVHACRAEGKPAAEGIQPAEVVVSRALMDPTRWLALARAYVLPEGRILAMMGGAAPEDGELAALGEAEGLRLDSVWRGALPEGQGQRVIAVWRAPDAGASSGQP